MKNVYLATPEDVGRVVRHERLARALSVHALAEHAAVSPHFVQSLEAGDPHADMAKVLSVLGALELHASVLPSTAPPHSIHEVDLDALIAAHA